MNRRNALKVLSLSAAVAVLMPALTACAGPSPQESAARAVENFLNAGYSGRAGKDFNLIRTAARSDINRIFSERFPEVAKYVDLSSAGPDQVLAQMRYFATMYDLSGGASVRVTVDPKQIEVPRDYFANVPNRAVTLYIDDKADIPSSSPDKLAYTVMRDGKSGAWLVMLDDPTARPKS